MLTQNPDVVVIGAGAAGLAATDTLIAAGLDPLCIEAADRIGGRIHADTKTLSQPFDRGAHWLHHADQNPFTGFAKTLGLGLIPERRNTQMHGANWAAVETHLAAAYADFLQGKDPLSSVSAPLKPTVNWLIGAYENGRDLADLCPQDLAKCADGPNVFCNVPLGTLFSRHHAKTPVSLNTAALEIDLTGKNIHIKTTQGTLTTRAVIVTLSTNLIASQSLKITPAPQPQINAADNLPLATYNHLILDFHRSPFGDIPDQEHLFAASGDTPKSLALWANLNGTSLAMAELGGGFAKELEIAGAAATTAFVTDHLKSWFGADILKNLTGTFAALWGNNPLIQGSYSSARKGKHTARSALADPFQNRVFFAGEATHPSLWGTVAGAHYEGVRAAQSLTALL